MQHKHFLLNLVIAAAALTGAALGGEFYLSTLLLLYPVYLLAFAIYLAIRYRRAPYPKTLLHYPLVSLLLYLLTLAFAWRTYHAIDRLAAARIGEFPVCPAGETCAPQVIRYHHYLDKHYIYERDSDCVTLRSPAYAFVKSETRHCRNAAKGNTP